MRHYNRNRKLGRVKRQRSALIRSLARSLVLSEAIVTTVAKAKELRPFVENLVTKSKESTGSRLISKRLTNSEEVREKLRKLARRFAKRAGGYTRIVRLGRIGKRVGEMARIEFVAAKES